LPQVPLEPNAAHQAARDRITLPAIFLLIMGVLNLLPAAYLILNGVFVAAVSPEQFRDMMIKQNPQTKEQLEQLEKQGWSVTAIKSMAQNVCLVGGIVPSLCAVLIVIGGVRMLQLRNYGLVVFSSVLAAIPCLSSSACCGVGEIIGLWAVFVLLRPEVRAAFR
jgi:hypothetical protein